jgi:hypothetical protein
MSNEVEYEVIGQEESTAPSKGKKRGRRTKAQALEGKTEQEIVAIEKDIADQNRLEEIDNKFGNGQMYEKTRVEIEVQNYLQTAAQASFLAGARLIQLKGHEGHGNFLESLKRIGLGEDTAERMMLMARKLQGTEIGNSATSRNLLPSKVYEITLFDQDTFNELELDCKERGAEALDKFARMTVRELRAYGRSEAKKHKEEIEARERVIKEKNDKLDEMDRELRGMPQKSQKDVNKAMLNELQLRFVARCSEITSILSELRSILDEAARLPEIDALQLSPFQNEIVRLGTENVAEDWEALCAVLEDYRPILDGEDA